MNLSEILKKNEKKLKNTQVIVRKPEISDKDRPYSEFIVQTIQPEVTIQKEIFDIGSKKNSIIQSNEFKEKKQEHLIKALEIKEDKSKNLKDFETVNNEYINLAGNEKKFMDYICETSIKTNYLEIGPIGIKEIIEQIGIKEKSIKQTINRLQKKGFLQKSSKRGQGGWRIFKLNQRILDSYQEILKKKEFKLSFIQNSLMTVDVIHDHPYTSKILSRLPEEWEELDIGGLDKFGFTKNHLIQLYQDISALSDNFGKEKLNIDSIQHSLYCFRWDLQNYYNELKEKYTSPIKMFIGTLRKGRPYNSIRPETFKTPEQIHWELYRQQIEKKKVILEQIKQQSFSIEFEEWQGKLSEQEIEYILPEETRQGLATLSPTIKIKLVKNALIAYFEKYIWPDHCNKLLPHTNI